MKTALMGIVTGLGLLGLAGNARADDNSMPAPSPSSTTMKRDSAMPDMHKQGSSYDTGMSNELTGRVVKADNKMVWIEHMGAVVPLKVDKNTRFDSAALKSAKDLKEGQEIRASFTVANRTDNLAKSISLAAATGGSGFNETGSDINGTPPSTLPNDMNKSPDLTPDPNQVPPPVQDKTKY